jgi:hypothetical protein
MKTLNFIKPRSLLLLTLSLASFNLASCGQKVQFGSSAGVGGLSESPSFPGEPDLGDVQPGENDGTGTTPPPPPPTTPSSTVDLFKQKNASKADILFVVDNSPSMEIDQKKLASKLKSFVTGLGNTDWQIAFTTTDVTSAQYGIKGSLLPLAGHGTEKVLTPAYADAETVFLNTVHRPEIASSDEQPLKASIMAMQKSATENASFFRPDADLVIIVLSDEDELSTGISNKATKPSQVIAAFNSIFGVTKKLSVYGIIIQPKDVACYNKQKGSGNFANAFYGTHVTELSKLTSGITGSICAPDYSQTLVNIGTDVTILSKTFVLQKIPVASSVQVKLTPAQSIAWTVSGATVTFASAPQAGSVIEVSYTAQ